MEKGGRSLEPYFRISHVLGQSFNRLGEEIKNRSQTHLNLNEFSVQEIIDLFKKALEYTLNLKNRYK